MLKSPKKYEINDSVVTTSVNTTIHSLKEVPQLPTAQKINVTGKVIFVQEPVNVHIKSKGEWVVKRDFILSDSTATCKAVVWGDAAVLKCGCSYNLLNVAVSSYNGIYLSVSSNSEIKEIDDIGEVLDQYQDDIQLSGLKEVYGEIVGVVRCESYYTCLVCRAKVSNCQTVTMGTTMGECGKCGLKVKLARCKKSIVATLLIQDEEGLEVKATAFENVINKLVQPNDDNVQLEEQLLNTSIMKFNLTTSNVIHSVSH